MELARASIDSRPEPTATASSSSVADSQQGVAGSEDGPSGPADSATGTPAPRRGGHGSRRLQQLWMELRPTILVYVASRALLLVLAVVDSALQHASFVSEVTNWDGFWYLTLATFGYPVHFTHLQTTLGFFPLYSMAIWLVAHVLFCSFTLAGLLISGFGGLVATVLVRQLCLRWWGARSAWRATVLFCLFPGSIVFSMVYSEGLLVPLAAGCLLALDRRRWALAGVLAAFATAVGPDALAIIPGCAVASLIELRRRGWRDREARRSLVAPLLSPLGIVAFGAFLWRWTGTPFATFRSQHFGWGERTDALALLHQARTLANEVSLSHFDVHAVNLNLVAGLLGAVVLAAGILLLLRRTNRVSAAAMIWTLAVGFLAVTSEFTPPNPRLLITAFPAVLVLAHAAGDRGYRWLITLSTTLLILMSALTYVGISLRP
jgi:hypothetical protein